MFYRNVKLFDRGSRVKYAELTPEYVYDTLKNNEITIGIVYDDELIGIVSEVTKVSDYRIYGTIFLDPTKRFALNQDWFINSYVKTEYRGYETFDIILEKGEKTFVQKIKDAITRFFLRS